MPVCLTLAYRRLCDGNSMVQEGTMWPQLVGQSVEFIRGLARKLTGTARRTFQAEVAREVCQGSPRLAESTFGWGREAVRKGLAEAEHDVTIVPNFDLRGRKRSEVQCAD